MAWHDSDLASNLSGIALVAVIGGFVIYGVRSCRSTPDYQEIKIDGRIYRYCEIEKGKAAVIEIDGRPVIDPSKLEEIAKAKEEAGKK